MSRSARVGILCVIFALLEVALCHRSLNGKETYVGLDVLKASKDRDIQKIIDGDKYYDSRFDTKEKTLIDIISDLDKSIVPELTRNLQPLFAQVENGEEHLRNVIRVIEGNVVRGEEEEEGDRLGCVACQLLVTALKALAAALEWEQIRKPLNGICITLGPVLVPGLRSEVLCPGILDAQGPVVYDMLLSPNLPRRHCVFLNACFPPRPESNVHKHTLPDRQGKRAVKPQKSLSLEGAIKIIQLADIHIEPDYTESSETNCGLPVCCLEDWGPGTAGRYGDYACNLPERTLDLFLDKARELDPDFLIYAGDSPPHTIWYETEESQFNCTRKVVAALKRGLPGVRVLPNIGNHEMYPTNIYFMDMEETQRANEMFITEWGSLANFTEEDVESMRTSAYFATRVAPGLVAISWNTNYMYSLNWYNVISEGVITAPPFNNVNYIREMEAFVEEKLAEAENVGDKVIMIGHHPSGGADSIILNSRWMNDVVARFPDVIVMHVAGHTHAGEFRMFRDPTSNAPTGVQHVMSAMSAGNYRNPALRVFYMNPEDFTLLDYDHYYLNIENIIDGIDPEIEFGFRATEEYGLPDMSAQSWWDFIERMQLDYGLFMTYYFNRETRSVRGHSCPQDSCMINVLCRAANTNFDDFFFCLEANTAPELTTAPPTQPDPPPDDGAASHAASVWLLSLAVFAVLYMPKLS